jgi:predicted methyltransferase
MRQPLAAAAAAALLALAVPVAAKDAVPAYVSAAVNDPSRGDELKLDANRKPLEVVAFTGVKPGAKVADLIPGHGYWSLIFSRIVGPKGHVYLIWPAEYAKEAGSEVTATQTWAKEPKYANVTILDQPAAAFAAPEKLDVVFTAQNYHDYPDKFMGPADPEKLDAQVFAALKPGGLFIVIDHAAEAGSGLRDTDTLHRIDPAVVKAQAKAAGFELVEESSALANPADDHKLLVFDKQIRGHTDQFMFKFRKPVRRGY